jgi:predicted secreted hydrolase
MAFAAGLSSCATLSLRPFNPNSHGGVYAEWVPHRDAGEWWYVTGRLEDGNKGLWLYQFTIFHEAHGLGQGYLLDLALSDYSTGQHLFEEYATTDSRKAFARNNTIVFENNTITLTHREITIHARGKRLAFDLTLIPRKPPVWQANNGVETMGRQGRSNRMSYYYSFTRLQTSGRISYVDSAGRRIARTVTGSSWLDRQWGNFSKSGWDWFSIRLFDGNDVMLYAFPSTGFKDGTVTGPKGRIRTFRDFSYRTDRRQTRNGSWYGLEWSMHIPILGRELRLVALSKNDFNPNRVMGYWEGLCKVYDSEGALVGYAVEETTASAHPTAKEALR